MLIWKNLDELLKGDVLVHEVAGKLVVLGLFEFITDEGTRLLYFDPLDEVYRTLCTEGVLTFSVLEERE